MWVENLNFSPLLMYFLICLFQTTWTISYCVMCLHCDFILHLFWSILNEKVMLYFWFYLQTYGLLTQNLGTRHHSSLTGMYSWCALKIDIENHIQTTLSVLVSQEDTPQRSTTHQYLVTALLSFLLCCFLRLLDWTGGESLGRLPWSLPAKE